VCSVDGALCIALLDIHINRKGFEGKSEKSKGFVVCWVNIYVHVVVLEINKLRALNTETVGSHTKYIHSPLKRNTFLNSVCTARKGNVF